MKLRFLVVAVLIAVAVDAHAQCPTSGPALSLPPNGSTNSGPTIGFVWLSVPGATLYKVFTSVNGGTFTQIATSSDTIASRIVPAGSIQWFVEADVPNCKPVQSAIGTFTVAQPACGSGTISLKSPQNGATTASPVQFSWTAVPGALFYRVWAAVDGSAPTNIGIANTPGATLAAPSGSIDWYVEAVFSGCPSMLSPHGNFTVSRSTSCTTAPATLVAPASGATVDTPVTIDWSDVPGAAAYRVWIAASGGPFVDEGFTKDSFLKVALNPGNYTWYVDTIYGGCPAVPSTTSTFTVPEPSVNCSNQPPVLTSPSPGSLQQSTVHFSWTAVPNVKQYRVYGSLNNGDLRLLGTTTRPSLSATIPFGSVAWFVEATFASCAPVRSAAARFSVARASVCPVQVPQLLSPAKGANDVTSPATFAWSASPNASGYVVIAKGQNGAATVIGETTATQLERAVPAGTVQWWVVAVGAGCDPVSSARSTFTVPLPPGCPTRRPHPLAPEDDATGAASPVRFEWTKSPGATSYKLFAGSDTDEPSIVATSATNTATVAMPEGAVRWYVEATADACPALFSAVNNLTIAPASSSCAPDRPQPHVIAQALSGTDYSVRWSGVPNASSYQIQESTTLTFVNAATQNVSATTATFNHTAAAAPAVYFYRVRAIGSCSEGSRSAFSKIVATRVVPPNAFNTKSRATAEIGTDKPIVQTLTVAGTTTPVPFTANTNRPWMTVSPSSGTIDKNGVTFTVTSDPTTLNVGSNQGAVVLSTSTADGKSTLPVSVSLVTPVAPDTTDTPSSDSLIIPAVVHGPGANNSQFQSDIRVANVSSQAQKYLVNFTPTGTDGTKTGTVATIQVDPGGSAALDDLLASFFGTASDGSAAGMLEIRPLTTASSSALFAALPSSALATVAASRTYNVTSSGTFGQFIPAVPFSQFVGQGSVLSLQQIAQSDAYRTNFGLVEAAGEPADVILHVFDDAGTKIADIPESLLPSEHLQLNGLLSGVKLDDGRIEVEVVSPTGKVTAYASVIDNKSNDPLLVSPVLKAAASTARSVIPGVAYSNGIANWRSDVRLFNASADKVAASLSYYPLGAPGSPVVRTVDVNAGETKALDNVLNATFGVNDAVAGGSLVVSTPSAVPLIASARTYAATDNGTIGQFIPAVTPDNSVGSGDRSLQIIQLESSASFRTNIGIAETSGNPVMVEIALNQSDTKVTPVIEWTLQPNEFIQLSLDQFGVPKPIYNARISVTVTSGSGKVTAYGSLIDNTSSDPTYVPAQ